MPNELAELRIEVLLCTWADAHKAWYYPTPYGSENEHIRAQAIRTMRAVVAELERRCAVPPADVREAANRVLEKHAHHVFNESGLTPKLCHWATMAQWITDTFPENS